MKKKVLSIFFALVIACVPLTRPGVVRAEWESCEGEYGINFSGSVPPSEIASPTYNFNFTLDGLTASGSYTLKVRSILTGSVTAVSSVISNGEGKANFAVPDAQAFPDGKDADSLGANKVYEFHLSGPSTTKGDCRLWEYTAISTLACDANSIRVFQERGGKRCYYKQGTPDSCLDTKSQTFFAATDLFMLSKPYNGPILLDVDFNGSTFGQHNLTSVNGTTNVVSYGFSDQQTGNYEVNLRSGIWSAKRCQANISVSLDCAALCLDSVDAAPGSLGPDKFNLCEQVKDPTAQQKCMQCAGGADGQEGIWTAVGCIKRQPEEIVSRFIRLGVSMGGGVALLMILAAGFTLTISQGNAQKTAQAKEMITAAVTGLLFIIFSITILQFIGFSILKIPGFGG